MTTIVKGESYEFELKAPQDAAYVAFGLSDDDKMGDDSVVECVRDQSGKFAAFMSRNLPGVKNVERLKRVCCFIYYIAYKILNLYFFSPRMESIFWKATWLMVKCIAELLEIPKLM